MRFIPKLKSFFLIIAPSISSSNDGQPQLDLNFEFELNRGLLQALQI